MAAPLVRLAQATGLAMVFAVSTLGGAVVHLRLEVARRELAKDITSLLAPVFEGKLTVVHIGSVGLNGISNAEIVVHHADGGEVLHAKGLSARTWVPKLLFDLVASPPALLIDIDRARLAEVTVALDEQPDRMPRVAAAFVPRKGDPASSSGPGKVVRVTIPRVEIRKAHAAGTLGPLEHLAIDLTSLAGSLVAGTERTILHAERFSFNAAGLAARETSGTAEVHIAAPSEKGRPVGGWVVFDGTVGQVPLSLKTSFDGDEIEVDAQVPKTTADAARDLLPGLPLAASAGAHLHAQGTLESLTATLQLEVEGGTVQGQGRASLAPFFRVEADVVAHELDARSLLADAPASAWNATGHVGLRAQDDGHLAGQFELSTEATQIARVDVPPSRIEGSFLGSELKVKAEVLEPGLPTHLHLTIHPKAALGQVSGQPFDTVVEFDAHGQSANLKTMPRLGSTLDGSLRFRARGQYASGLLTGQLTAETPKLQAAGITLEEGRLRVDLHGSPAHVQMVGELASRDLQLSGRSLGTFRAGVSGPLEKPRVQVRAGGGALPEIVAQASLEWTPKGIAARDFEISAQRGEARVVGKVRAFALSADDWSVDGLQLEGLGDPVRADLLWHAGHLRGQAHATRIDLMRVGQLFLPGAAQDIGGQLAIDLEAGGQQGVAFAHLRATLRDGAFPLVPHVDAAFEGTLDGSAAELGLQGSVADWGNFSLAMNGLTLPPGLWTKDSWTKISGDASFTSSLRLEKAETLVAFLPAAARAPLAQLPSPWGGALGVRCDVHRPAHQRYPDVQTYVWTEQLSMGSGDDAAVPAGDLDVQAGLDVRGESGTSQLTTRVLQSASVLGVLTAIADLPIDKLYEERTALGSALLRLPVTAHLVLPPRALAKYPRVLALPGVSGVWSADATLAGTLLEPQLHVAASGKSLQAIAANEGVPLDARLELTYERDLAHAHLKLLRSGQGEATAANAKTGDAPACGMTDQDSGSGCESAVLDTQAAISIHLPALYSSAKGPLRWTAAGEARLSDFPLQSVAMFSDHDVKGLVQGTLAFAHLNDKPQARAELHFRDLSVSTARFPTSIAVFTIDSGAAVASLRLDRPDGHLGASATAGVVWRSPFFPVLDEKKPQDLYLDAQNVPAATLHPLLESIFAHLEGDLDGTAHLRHALAPKGALDTVEGNASLSEGSFLVPQIGQEFRHARATVTAASDGWIRVRDLSAEGTSGRASGSMNVHLDGFAFRDAEGALSIGQAEQLPLTLEGVPLGDVWGRFELRARRQTPDPLIRIDVDAPQLHVELSERSRHGVQPLGDNTQIRVGVRQASGSLSPVLLGEREEPRAKDALNWHLAVNLGQDVTLRRGSQLSLRLTGSPMVSFEEQTRVTGDVRLAGGDVDILGKNFAIVTGFARFEGDDASNPLVSLTAVWESPDGTRIFADYAGPLQTGTLAFRSEPARPQSEIMALLFFGSPTTGTGTSAGADSTTAAAATGVGVGGGVATSGLNEAISGVTNGNIATRVDTSVANSPRPEVEVQISRDVSAQVSYRAFAALGQSPDRVFLTFDWRFKRNWSVLTTVGNQGSSILDLLWQYRY